MAEGGAVSNSSLSEAMKKKEALEEEEKQSLEKLETRQKQMESISKVENDIDDLLAFANKYKSKVVEEDGPK